MLTSEIQKIILDNTIGFVATINPDGSPAVSPKGTFVILDDKTLAFSDIRSPGTVRNINHNPAVEVNFIDIFHRTGCRVKGTAHYCKLGEIAEPVLATFTKKWPQLVNLMKGFIIVDVSHAKFLRSPSYDIGLQHDDLARHWLNFYTELLSSRAVETRDS